MLTFVRQPYNIIEHRIRNAIRGWSIIFNLMSILFMSSVATAFFTISVTSLVLCSFGHWTFIFVAILFMWLARIIVEQMRNSLDNMIKFIAEIVGLVIPVVLLALFFCGLLHFGIVTKNHLRILKFASWILPPVISDSLNGILQFQLSIIRIVIIITVLFNSCVGPLARTK